ncbi:uncharacterized protein BT62DRAFT_937821 [Guyanagaster necrorhizus]|uniref:Protein transport protein SEC31 n=1 Tax=Guyanagaster necrorhizus TaxID=856835 RepID=A0A9P7VHI3_9AGAR|nr:uncharacterized protein BT62DRAFT_937821 [Guyanagaster necrorhizus MCA 3950]KAG7440702.1 hypothetical protein BT62DRAFT_937821 [Guyanagaster necrorhizus MCA 3950]
MKLKEIHRTSTFTWSPSSSLPLIATGTVAGALDESFSNESQLEIWAPNFLDKNEFDLGIQGQSGPKGAMKDTARFNRLTWGYVDSSRLQGVIAAGMENGELALWDPAKILAGDSSSESLILRNNNHTGPIRALDFNPLQTHLLSSGAVNGEVCIWDLKDPTKPYAPTPGSRSTKLDEITSVAWNQQVPYVLAGASTTGYTVVWDLRGKREVVALAYGGGAGTLAGQVSATNSLALGGRRGMSAIAWHPDNATRLVTASEDDSSPIIMVWDLRNARAPEKILTGHEKGVLSLSWCKQDADMLLSCGKDNRALCWNPQTSEIIGELPSASNWAFQVEWCPRNPDLLATAFFDGTVGIHSIQSTNEPPAVATSAAAGNGADIFDSTGYSQAQGGTLSLKQPPKWLRRPASNSFGFGGKLVSVSNLPSAQGKHQSAVVHLRKVVTEQDLVVQATKLKAAIEGDSLKAFAREKADGTPSEQEAWKALLSLFQADSRDELVTLLGFSKADIAARVAEAVEKLKLAKESSEEEVDTEGNDFELKPHEPVVSFAEEHTFHVASDDEPFGGTIEKTPSEISADATSEGTRLADAESTTTAPSLFGDDGPGMPQRDVAGADFFSSIGLSGESVPPMDVPHTNYGIDSSVAATIGSGPSSVTSETSKSNTFKIYPADESETDRLVTKALVLGDFDSAVSLCLSSDRFADAILLAARGGPELLQRTQKTYFDRRTNTYPYLRLFQSIVTNDLSDIVQNAGLQEWQEIFVVICTFAGKEEFSTLAEQLGRRLEFQFAVSNASEDFVQASQFRKYAILTYLAAARLERIASIWSEEMAEQESVLLEDTKHQVDSYYTVHAQALQSFIEKVTVFRSATKYVDGDLQQDSDTGTFKLANLYDRYFEYASLLASQGLVEEATVFLKLTPSGYKGPGSVIRERLLTTKTEPAGTSTIKIATKALPAQSTTYSVYPPSFSAGPQTAATGPSPYTSSFSAGPQSATTGVSPYAPYAPSVPAPTNPAYAPPSNVGVPAPGFNTFTQGQSLTQPPHLRATLPPRQPPAPVPPPPKRTENGGWNDAPVVDNSRSPSAPFPSKPAAITSPFPNSTPEPTLGGHVLPPRPGSVGGAKMPLPPPPARGMYPPPVRPPSGATRITSPPPRLPTPSQYAPRAPVAGQTPPSGQFARAPQQQHHPHPPPPSGPYIRATPPPGPGPYAHASPSEQAGPYGPAQVGPYAPAHGDGAYAPPPSVQPPPMNQAPPPPPPPPPPAAAAAASRAVNAPPAPKYPPGDRTHIPDNLRPAYEILSAQLSHMRQVTPPTQRRKVDDVERRVSPLFDALNCETLSKPVADQLLVLTRAMEVHDRPAALAIHVDLLTKGSQTDDIALWMSGVKQLIMRL